MIATPAKNVFETNARDADENIFSDSRAEESRRVNNDPRERQPKPNQQPRRDKRDIHGWIVLDKPIGMTSTQAVAVIKRLFSAKRAGHAGTLDPLASGGLPVALGEATKTVPFVMDGRKRYRFTVRWGEGRDPCAAAALHRADRTGSAAIFRDQDSGRARLRSRARGRSPRPEAEAGRD